MNLSLAAAVATALFAFSAIPAFADTPAHEFFPGHGNPQDFILTTQDGIQIGLQAQPRFDGGPVTRVGDTYFAQPGAGTSPTLSTWNFDFIIDTNPTNAATPDHTLSDYTAVLFINGPGATGLIPPLAIPDNSPSGSTTLAQNSENLGFFFSPTFDPNQTGLYTFSLVLTPVGVTSFIPVSSPAVSMNVQVGAVAVPLPAAAPAGFASLLLLGAGCLLRKKLRHA